MSEHTNTEEMAPLSLEQAAGNLVAYAIDMGRHHQVRSIDLEALEKALEARERAGAAIAAKTVEAADTRVAASLRLCEIYFDIAASVLGEDEVRRRRDARLDELGAKALIMAAQHPDLRWGDPVEWESDDRDADEPMKVQLQQGGNGDYYIAVMPVGHRLARGVRVSMSGGAATENPAFALAIAAAYRALFNRATGQAT